MQIICIVSVIKNQYGRSLDTMLVFSNEMVKFSLRDSYTCKFMCSCSVAEAENHQSSRVHQYLCGKQNHVSAIHTYRGLRNMQDPYLNRLLNFNIDTLVHIAIPSDRPFIHPKMDKFRGIPSRFRVNNNEYYLSSKSALHHWNK